MPVSLSSLPTVSLFHLAASKTSLTDDRCSLPFAVIGSDQKLIIDDTSQDPRFAEIPGEQQRSIVCLPLHHRGRTMGCVYLSSSRLNQFTQTVLDVLTILSTRTSVAFLEATHRNSSLTSARLHRSEACIAIGNAMLFKKLQRATQANLKMIVKCVDHPFHRFQFGR